MKFSSLAHGIKGFFRFFASITLLSIPFLILLALGFDIVKEVGGDSEKLPTIEYYSENGEKQRLDIKKSPITLIHFWATWCAVCKTEFPKINALQKRHNGGDISVIALSLDEIDKRAGEVRKFYDEHDIDYLPIAYDKNMENFNKLEIDSLPTGIIVDSSGERLVRVIGDYSWQDKDIYEEIERGKMCKNSFIYRFSHISCLL